MQAAALLVAGGTAWDALEDSASLLPYDRGDVVTQMRQLLPGGVDTILDAVVGEPMRHVAILITNSARIVSVADLHVAELGGSFLVSSPAGVPALAHLVAAGKIGPKVLQTYPFDQASQAL
ncbi:MAG: zinc-binding dehydrogenase [Pseudonocardiaceae bacterium]